LPSAPNFVILDERMIYRKREGVVSRRVGDEVVIVPIRNNVGDLDSVYTLNEVAARVWSLLDGLRDADSVVEAICSEFAVEHNVASHDLGELFASLEAAHLIQRTE
jgi:hypothetical protein